VGTDVRRLDDVDSYARCVAWLVGNAGGSRGRRQGELKTGLVNMELEAMAAEA
jgi:hypothetical protein